MTILYYQAEAAVVIFGGKERVNHAWWAIVWIVGTIISLGVLVNTEMTTTVELLRDNSQVYTWIDVFKQEECLIG